MTSERPENPRTGRESPVGKPVVRGDATIAGERAREAVQFDPDNPESLETAAETVRQFAENTVGGEDNIYMLRGAAACAALVRGEGSYKAAAERAGEEASVAFIRKWARVHDLPQSVRRHVAMGHIAPTAAKHIARVAGDARFQLAWATVDNDLTVREIRSIASEINDGMTPEEALSAHGVTAGELIVRLSAESYRELRREAVFGGVPPGEIVDAALADYFE